MHTNVRALAGARGTLATKDTASSFYCDPDYYERGGDNRDSGRDSGGDNGGKGNGGDIDNGGKGNGGKDTGGKGNEGEGTGGKDTGGRAMGETLMTGGWVLGGRAMRETSTGGISCDVSTEIHDSYTNTQANITPPLMSVQ